MGMDAYWTIAAREPRRASEVELTAFIGDLHRYAIIDQRFTLISSPTAAMSRSGVYTGFPGPPGDWSHLVHGPYLAPGSIIDGWFPVPGGPCPATVHYDGANLAGVLASLPAAGIGAGDVFLLAWPGRSLAGVANAVAVPALAAPAMYEPFDGSWAPYQESVVHDRWEEGPWTEADDDPERPPAGDARCHRVQWSFDTWASGGGTDHCVLPLSEVLRRHLGDDLMVASAWL